MRGGYGWTYVLRRRARRPARWCYDQSIVASRRPDAGRRRFGACRRQVCRRAGEPEVAVDRRHDRVQGRRHQPGRSCLTTHVAPYAVCAKPCDKSAVADIGGRARDRRGAAHLRPADDPAGDLHTFQTLDADGGLSQVIVGNGGADLDPFPDGVCRRRSRASPSLTGAARREMAGSSPRRVVWPGPAVGFRHGFGILTPATLGSRCTTRPASASSPASLAGERAPRCR